MKKNLVVFIGMLWSWNMLPAQSNLQTNWGQLEQVLSSTRLKEFIYKKGSLYNEAEGMSDSEEVPAAIFFPVSDSTNKNLAFILAFQSSAHFKQEEGIIQESQVYMYNNRKCYYRETSHIQILYMDFEKQGITVCIVFRKNAMHEQKFIESLFDELKVEAILATCFKQ
jgi:hypothetical protein